LVPRGARGCCRRPGSADAGGTACWGLQMSRVGLCASNPRAVGACARACCQLAGEEAWSRSGCKGGAAARGGAAGGVGSSAGHDEGRGRPRASGAGSQARRARAGVQALVLDGDVRGVVAARLVPGHDAPAGRGHLGRPVLQPPAALLAPERARRRPRCLRARRPAPAARAHCHGTTRGALPLF